MLSLSRVLRAFKQSNSQTAKQPNSQTVTTILRCPIRKLILILCLIILPTAGLAASERALVSYAGINLAMSVEDRLTRLNSQGFSCKTREFVPYQGHWECNRKNANIIFDSAEMLMNCAALRNCNKNLEEIALSVLADNDFAAMNQIIFYPPIGKVRWHCGESEARNLKVCVHQLVSVNHEMVEIERARGDGEAIDFLLSKRRPHLHITRLKGPMQRQFDRLEQGAVASNLD
jgi:hypothetical protein